MPENKDGKWSPKDLYATPEFPEDEGRVTQYAEPEAQGGLRMLFMAAAAAAIVLLGVLALTGVIRLPAAAGSGEGGPAVSLPKPAAGMPVVSEFMTNNGGAFAADNGKYYDWIEIYNPTDRAVNLSGFGLSDDAGKPDKFILPDYTLESGGFLIVFASGNEPSKKRIEAPFKLKSSGTLVLTDAQGKRIQQVDYLNVPDGSSFFMDMSDFTKWSSTAKLTPGFPNTDEGYASFLAARPSAEPKN